MGSNIRYIFFDFGGCLDSAGIHTRTLFLDAFVNHRLLPREQASSFQEAYSRADEKMMRTGLAKAMELREFNRLNGALIAADLKLQTRGVVEACDAVTEQMRASLVSSRPILSALSQRYPLGIISNFTGNLEVILREFDLRDLFHSVTESFYVGASKPDPKIFAAALAKQPHLPEQCLYVGDNPKNDVVPGKQAGMKCVLIHAAGEKKECGADGYIQDLAELEALLQGL